METGYVAAKLTYADFRRFPDDGLRHEIIDGAHYVTPSPATRHQRISRNLAYLLQTYLEAHPVGEVFYAPLDVLLSKHDIVEPDLLYVSNERAGVIGSKNLQGPPDLVIEILSPTTSRRDRELKRDLYERVGVTEYWLVDPKRDVVDVYRRGRKGFPKRPRSFARNAALASPLFPSLALPLDRVFGEKTKPRASKLDDRVNRD